SFGYGGFCLPKDTKQLRANFEDIPNNMINAIVDSNDTRKDHVANQILKQKPKVVGIYRLTMKTGSDNFRQSAIQGIIERLNKQDIEVIVYETSLDEAEFVGLAVVNDFGAFKKQSDVIVVNRLDDEIRDVREKVYTRDLFSRD